MKQSTINKKLSDLKKQWSIDDPYPVCECCESAPATDMDHSISQKRCKELGKYELIWDKENISRSCRSCHTTWESYKSGIFEDHANVIDRMKFVCKHDLETFEKRMQAMNNYEIMCFLRAYQSEL